MNPPIQQAVGAKSSPRQNHTWAQSIAPLLLLMLALGACTNLQNTAPTPLVITATLPQQFIIVTNTPTPSPSPVLAPTLPITEVAQVNGENSTPQATSTPAITMTPTFTVTPTDTPVTPGALIQPVGGFALVEASDCTSLPTGGFGTLFSNNAELALQIGCPLGTALTVGDAYQEYERGLMVWVSSVGGTGQPGIYAILNNGSYQRFNDTWIDGVDPVSLGTAPPAGLIEPIRGFGKVWRENPSISETIGWARTGEGGGSATVQAFERGEMLYLPQNGQTYILVSGQPGTWTSVTQPF